MLFPWDCWTPSAWLSTVLARIESSAAATAAEPSTRILSRTLAQAAALVGMGLFAASVLPIWAWRASSSLVSATAVDLLTVLVPAMIVVAAGAAAGLPSARRAGRTDPIKALRAD